MHYKHDREESFSSLEEYFKYKRRVDLAKLEAFVRQQDEQQDDGNELNASLDINEEMSRVEKAKMVLANRELFENDLNLDLEMDPDISCPVLNNEERMEKLVSSDDGQATTTASLEMFDKTECDEVNAIIKSREICGCECQARNQSCTSDDCSCYANGINCQIDRCAPFSYPCSCNAKRCKNKFGLKKFNWRLVEKHRKEVLGRNMNTENEPESTVSEIATNNERPPSTPNKAKRKKKRTLSSYSPHKRKKASSS